MPPASHAIDRLWSRAQRYLGQAQLVHAKATLDAMLATGIQSTRSHVLMAQIAREEDRIRDADRFACAAAGVPCDDPDLLCEVIAALQQTGETAAMHECLARPALSHPATGALALELADFHQWLGQNPNALALVERARALGADTAPVRFRHGTQLAFSGRLQEAEAELEACLRMAPASGRAAILLARIRTQTPGRNHLALFEHCLRAVGGSTRERAALEFARYKTLEDLGKYEAAWQALATANRLMHACIPDDGARQRHFIDALVARFAPPAQDPPAAPGTGVTPIFIVGLPRSGTTLLERILGNHAKVAMGGELGDFGAQLKWGADHADAQDDTFLDRVSTLPYADVGRRYLLQTQWRAGGKPFLTDKQPSNWLSAGFIAAALPTARILHLVRAPLDVCFSNWRAFFGSTCAYSYDLDVLATHYRGYRRLMEHWRRLFPGRIMDVPYARLVHEPEIMAREIFAFCGLDWDPACLDLARNHAPVATLSVAQVRDSIHARTCEAWRPYVRQLSGLRDALEDLALPAGG